MMELLRGVDSLDIISALVIGAGMGTLLLRYFWEDVE